MKHRTIPIVLTAGLLLFFMVWGFGSSSANEGKQPAESEPSIGTAPTPTSTNPIDQSDFFVRQQYWI